MFNDFDEVSIHLIFSHGGPQCAVPYSAKRLFEASDDMVQILLVLTMFFAQDYQIEDLFCCASSCHETSLFFCDDSLCLWFQPVEKHPQPDFARMVYETWCSSSGTFADSPFLVV